LVPAHFKPGLLDALLADLARETAKLVANPGELTGRAAVYGMAQKIPKTLVGELAAGFLDLLYSTRGPT